MVDATDYLWRASSHCARTSATAEDDPARPQDLAQSKPAQCEANPGLSWLRAMDCDSDQ